MGYCSDSTWMDAVHMTIYAAECCLDYSPVVYFFNVVGGQLRVSKSDVHMAVFIKICHSYGLCVLKEHAQKVKRLGCTLCGREHYHVYCKAVIMPGGGILNSELWWLMSLRALQRVIWGSVTIAIIVGGVASPRATAV